MLVRSKIFPQFVEKIENLKLSLSKQRNKMIKIRSEILKIIKMAEDFRDSGNFPESILKISLFLKFENPIKRKP